MKRFYTKKVLLSVILSVNFGISSSTTLDCSSVADAVAQCPNTCVTSTTCPTIAEEAAQCVPQNLQCLINNGCTEQEAEDLCLESIDQSLGLFPCFETLKPLCYNMNCSSVADAIAQCPNTYVNSTTCPTIAEEAAQGVPENLQCLIEKGCTEQEAEDLCLESIEQFSGIFPCFESLKPLCYDMNCSSVVDAIAQCPNTCVNSMTCPTIAEEAAQCVPENLLCLIDKGCTEQEAEDLCLESIDQFSGPFPCFESLKPLCEGKYPSTAPTEQPSGRPKKHWRAKKSKTMKSKTKKGIKPPKKQWQAKKSKTKKSKSKKGKTSAKKNKKGIKPPKKQWQAKKSKRRKSKTKKGKKKPKKTKKGAKKV